MRGRIVLKILCGVVCSLMGAQLEASQPAAPPFTLTTDEQKDVDRVLDRWEQWNSRVKTLDCRFRRWAYDSVFGPPDRAKFIDLGGIRYAAGRSMFWVDKTERDGQIQPISNDREERWIFDRKSFWVTCASAKHVVEVRLPVGWEPGKYVDGPMAWPVPVSALSRWWCGETALPPLPFPLAARAETLRQHFYLRIDPQALPIKNAMAPKLVCLEAYPRSKTGDSLCKRLQFLFSVGDMSLWAMNIIQPNEVDRSVYQFYDIRVNDPSWRADEKAFQPSIPDGWQLVPVM
jgi:hypothetical protein